MDLVAYYENGWRKFIYKEINYKKWLKNKIIFFSYNKYLIRMSERKKTHDKTINNYFLLQDLEN